MKNLPDSVRIVEVAIFGSASEAFSRALWRALPGQKAARANGDTT